MANKRPVASLNTREYDALLSVLKEARKEVGISQEKLSAQLGQSINYVLKVEQKDRRLDVVEFIQLAQALGLEPRELFDRVMKKVER